MQIIDNYADVLNYENPFTKYFYGISNGLFEESYTANHLNFNPATLITNDAIFFDNDKKSISYIFQQNEKVTGDPGKTGIYVAFYFWMQNSMHYYERKYRNFQDALSDIGGLASLLYNAAYIVNFLVSNFVILFDTEGLLDEIESSKKFSKNVIRNNVYKNLIQNQNLTPNTESLERNNGDKNNINKINTPPIRKANQKINYNDFTNSGSITNNVFFVCDNNSNKINEKDIENNQKKKPNLKIAKKNSLINRNKINIFNFKDKMGRKPEKKRTFRKSVNFKYMVDFYSLNKKKNKTKKNKAKNRMKFWEYISFFFSCGKFHQKMNCYDEFRCRIISEENLILNYLNVCKLLKATKHIIKDIEDDKAVNT